MSTSGKTNTELIRELSGELKTQIERTDNDRQNFVRIETSLEKACDGLASVRERLAVLESKFADLKAAQDERDRRLWTVWLAVLGSILAMAVNIALIFLKR